MTRKMAKTAVSTLALGLALVLSVGSATSASAQDGDHRNFAGRQHANASGERSGPIWRDNSNEQRTEPRNDGGNRGNWGGGNRSGGDRGQRGGQNGGQGGGQGAAQPSGGNSGGGWQNRDGNRGGWNGGSRDNTPPAVVQPAAPQPSGDRDRGAGAGWNRGGGSTVWNGGNRAQDNDRRDNDNRGGWNRDRGNTDRRDNDRRDNDRRDNDRRDNDRHDNDNRGGWSGNHDRGGWNNDRDRGGWNGNRGNGHRFDYRNDRRWNNYSGVRFGFYFFPGRGYYHVPDQYYGHRWLRGEYLPRMFYDYRIYDYDFYGLPVPPYGCAWFFVGEDAVLIDLRTSEVIDVWYDVW